MLRLPGKRLRPVEHLAIDLGTARTQVWAPGDGVLLDEPTLVAFDGTGIVAAGARAWEVTTTTPARLRFPVRAALAVDPIDCVRFLQLLLDQAGLASTGPVVLAIPAAASAYEASVLAAVVSSATGSAVIPVDSLLAAATGLGLPVGEPAAGLLCDVGAGVLEIGVVGNGQLRARTCVTVGTRDYLDDPQRLVSPARWALRRVLDEVPGVGGDVISGDGVAGAVHLVGGGALLPGLREDLADALRTDVVVPDDPRAAVVQGLARCAESALAA